MRFTILYLISVFWLLASPNAQTNELSAANLAVSSVSNVDHIIELSRIGRGTIETIAWSPDEETIALGGSLGIWLFEADALDREPILLEDTDPVEVLAFSADSNWLATATNQTTKLWNLSTNQAVAVMPGGASVLAFSSDDLFLGAGYSSGHIRLWNVNAEATEIGKLISTFRIDNENVTDIAFSPNDEEILSLQSGEIRQWRIRDGALLSRLDTVKTDALGNPVPALRRIDPHNPYRTITGGITPTRGAIEDGRIISITLPGSEPGRLSLLDSLNGSEAWSIDLFSNDITAAAFSPDGQVVAAAGEEGVIKIVNAQTGETQISIDTDGIATTMLAFSPDSSRLLRLNQFGMVTAWNVEQGLHVDMLSDDFVPHLFDLAISLDQKQIAVGTINVDLPGMDYAENPGPGSLRRWDIESGEMLSPLFLLPAITQAVEYRPDGKQVAAINNLSYIELMDTQTTDELRTMVLWRDDIPFVAIAYSPDSTTIFSTSADQTGQLWDTNTGDPIGAAFELRGIGQAVTFTPDGRYVIVGTDNGYVEIWESRSQQSTIEPVYAGWTVESVDISPDGGVILTSGQNIRLLDFYTGHILASFDGSDAPALFSLNSSIIFSGFGSKIRAWDTCTGQLLHELSGHNDRIEALAISSDGTLLVSTSRDGTIRLWDVAGAEMPETQPVGASCRITPTPIPTITLTPTVTLTASSTPTITPTPTYTPTITPLPAACQDAPIPRLMIGMPGRVLDDDPSPINMREGGGTQFNRIAQIPAGGLFMVLSGPVCADGYFWYEVDYNGTVGWIAEGDSTNYYTETAPYLSDDT